VPISLTTTENEARFMPDVCAGGDLQVFCKPKRGRLWDCRSCLNNAIKQPSMRAAFLVSRMPETEGSTHHARGRGGAWCVICL